MNAGKCSMTRWWLLLLHWLVSVFRLLFEWLELLFYSGHVLRSGVSLALGNLIATVAVVVVLCFVSVNATSDKAKDLGKNGC